MFYKFTMFVHHMVGTSMNLILIGSMKIVYINSIKKDEKEVQAQKNTFQITKNLNFVKDLASAN